MSLVASFNGQRIISVLLSDAQWHQAKLLSEEGHLLIADTGLPGHPQTSPLGLRYFAHMPGQAPEGKASEPEGIEHLMLKAELVKELAAAAWQVDAEVPSGPEREWVADVLAEKNGVRYAFEVQWSKQSVGDFVRRQLRYQAAGIRGIWLARDAPRHGEVKNSLLASDYAQIPIFHLADTYRLTAELHKGAADANQWMRVQMEATEGSKHRGNLKLTIKGLIAAVEAEALLSYGTLPFTMYKVNCWRCKQDMACWTIEQSHSSHEGDRPEADDLVLQQALAVLNDANSATPLADLQLRGGKASAAPEMLFCCPSCGVQQAKSFEGRHLLEAQQRSNRHVNTLIATTAEWDAFTARWGFYGGRWVHLRLPAGFGA